MQKIKPFLWFDGNGREAIEFYVSVFKNSRIVSIDVLDDASNMLIGNFEIEGQSFTILNGGPVYAGFTPAISFFVNCLDQDEVDYYWDRLVDGGSPMQCGWLKDKFGLCWQIIPSEMGELMSDPDPVKARRVMQAMMQMIKIDVNELRKARDGGE